MASLGTTAERFFGHCGDDKFVEFMDALSDNRYWAAVRVVREVLPDLTLEHAQLVANEIEAWRRRGGER